MNTSRGGQIDLNFIRSDLQMKPLHIWWRMPFLIWLMLSFLVMSRVHLDKLQTFLNYLLPILMKLDLSINLTFDTNHSFNTCEINHSDKIDNNWWLLFGWDLALHSLMSLWNSGFCESQCNESSNIFANLSHLIICLDPRHSYNQWVFTALSVAAR